MIQRIKKVRTELHRLSFPNGNSLEDQQVKIRGARTDDVVSLFVAELAHTRLHIATGIEPLSNRLVGRPVPVADLVSALALVSPRIGKIGSGDIEWKAALHGKDTASLPSPNQGVGEPIRRAEKLFPLSERKLVHPAEFEHLPRIEVRLPILCLHIWPILGILCAVIQSIHRLGPDVVRMHRKAVGEAALELSFEAVVVSVGDYARNLIHVSHIGIGSPTLDRSGIAGINGQRGLIRGVPDLDVIGLTADVGDRRKPLRPEAPLESKDSTVEPMASSYSAET